MAYPNAQTLMARARKAAGLEDFGPATFVAGLEENDPRRVAYKRMVETLMRDDPDQAAMHIWEADASVEDTEVLGLEFHAQQMTMPVWRYHRWWRAEDMRANFAYHARGARLLQSRRPPNRWLFKAPNHKFHLDHMVDAYPDIRFIFTQRGPGHLVPSYASFVASLYPADVVAKIGRPRIGAEINCVCALRSGLRAMLPARTARISTPPDDYRLSADMIRSDYAFYTGAFDLDLGVRA